MKITETINLFDDYNRRARLYPGLLTIAPVFWTVAALNPNLIVGSASHVLGSVILVSGALSLLSNLARWRGKIAERVLIEKWGGWPSTVLLRHRDSTIDSFTKARYHRELETICGGLKLPTADEEKGNPSDADARYRSATRRLIERRREKKYQLLHRENVQYGFRRNLLGLKPSALAILCLLTLFAGVTLSYGANTPISSWESVYADFRDRQPLYLLLLANLLAITVWVWAIRPNFVKQASEEYALALFRTLD